MEVVIKILQLLLSLSILVIIHEFGHFIAAKAFKTRVEKFFLFFNPWFSLFKIKYGETEYGIGWLPLGGYVKIAGMIDESMDKEQLKKPPQPWEFRSKPPWQRLIIMLGGVTMNIILAVFIYITMLLVWGDEYLPTSEVKYGIRVDSLAMEAGLRNGDKILSVDNEYVEIFRKIPEKIILDDAKTIQVERNGEIINLEIPQGFLGKLIKHKSPDFITFRFPFEVGDFSKKSAGKAAGIQLNDKIIALNGKPTEYFFDFYNELQNHKNEEISVSVIRNSDTLNINVVVPAAGKLGIAHKPIENYFEFSKIKYSFFSAVPAGVDKAYKGVGNYLKSLKLLFNPEIKAYESVGGFITIGNIFPAQWHWQSFWTLTAFLSIMLAILNVLPIPALDGGHVLFLFYEIITRRKPSDKFMEYAQIVGMVILFGLLIFANGNDIFRLFNK
ncbi:MAG: RIP metalloprotease RseP [Bacteroidetes bacterium 4484_249]|nr:MAG: RIP metalloprotease RseP [Bacteroidetes bacterium 4484_249]